MRSRVVLVVAVLLAGLWSGVSPASAVVTPHLSVGPHNGTTTTIFDGGGSGFTPSTTATITVQQPDGQPYAGTFTHTKPIDASGAIKWTWQWDPGDEFGTYVFTATDATGPSASVTFTIAAPDFTHPAPMVGFDTASAPAQATMDTWLGTSTYRAVGVYVPVGQFDDRHDKVQANLTPSWVQTQRQDGWSIVPIYLGEQAPTACQNHPGTFWEMPADVASARSHGAAAAIDASTSLAGLGLPATAPVYYDMEPYTNGCSAAVMAFVDGWVTELHAHGHVAGVYGTYGSVIDELVAARNDPSVHQPDGIWVATNNGSNGVLGLPQPADDSLWAHARINQSMLDITEAHGGVSQPIDVDPVDGPVVGPTGAPAAPTGVHAVAGTGGATVSWTGGRSSPYVTSYRVIASPGGRSVTVGFSSRDAVVSGLRNGTSYTFSVVATSSEGDSAPSAASAPVTPAGPPARVGKARLKLQRGRLVVTWKAPADNGAKIVKYLVKVNRSKRVVKHGHRLVVKHLHRGLYTVTVVAVNKLGQAKASQPVRIRVR